MPHTPGHRYIIRETGEEYRGRTVKRGNKLFTTSGGGFEGDFSHELIEEGGDNMTMEDNQPVSTDNNDIVTQFIVGENRGNKFYHSTFSNQDYYYANGNKIRSGTKLHHHTIPPEGRSNFMTQHNMNGAKDVSPTRPTMKRMRNRISRQQNQSLLRRRAAMSRMSRLGGANLNPNGMNRTMRTNAQRQMTQTAITNRTANVPMTPTRTTPMDRNDARRESSMMNPARGTMRTNTQRTQTTQTQRRTQTSGGGMGGGRTGGGY